MNARTTDYAGNVSSVATTTFDYDTTAPTASFTIVPGTNPLYQYYALGIPDAVLQPDRLRRFHDRRLRLQRQR